MLCRSQRHFNILFLSCHFPMKFLPRLFVSLSHPTNICFSRSQVYEIFSFKIKSAESAIPKAWVLERSTDGFSYEPWQYFAVDDDDCMSRYNLAGACSCSSLCCVIINISLITIDRSECKIHFQGRQRSDLQHGVLRFVETEIRRSKVCCSPKATD